LNDWAANRGLNAGTFNTMRPWLVALMISATEYAALGAEPERGVDRVFEKRSARDGKPGEGLETVDFQIGLFTALSEAQQQELLEQTLAEVKSLGAQYQKMIDSWKAGDADALHQMLFRRGGEIPGPARPLPHPAQRPLAGAAGAPPRGPGACDGAGRWRAHGGEGGGDRPAPEARLPSAQAVRGGSGEIQITPVMRQEFTLTPHRLSGN